MPFVTEALWAALPRSVEDPELLIVARWPSAAGQPAAVRDEGLEGGVGQVLDLVRAIRNARATAGVPASAWLPLDVFAPATLESTYAALAPAVERLARARPLTRAPERAALDLAPAGSLGIVAGDIEARLHAAAETSDADREQNREGAGAGQRGARIDPCASRRPDVPRASARSDRRWGADPRGGARRVAARSPAEVPRLSGLVEAGVVYQVYPRSFADSNGGRARRSGRDHRAPRPP